MATMTVKDGLGAPQQLAVEAGQSGALTPRSVPEVGGAAVSDANPVPQKAMVGGAAVSDTNPMPQKAMLGGQAVSDANPMPFKPMVGGAAVSETNGLPVKAQTGAITDASGAIGTDSMRVLLAVVRRSYLLVQNLSDSAVVGLNFGAAATLGSGSIQIQPGGCFEMSAGFVSNQEIYLIASAAPTAVTIKAA